MGLLGGIGSALGGLFKDTPGGMSAADKLTLIGSALSDFSNGGEPNMTLQARQMIAGNAEQRQKRAAMDQLTQILMGGDQQAITPPPPAPPIMQGPGMDGSPVSPPRTATSAPLPVSQPSPLNINDPRMMPVALAAMRSGINLAPVLDVMKAQQPHYINVGGQLVDDRTGSKGSYIDDPKNGFLTNLGPNGEIAGVRDLPGYAGIQAQNAAATTGAQEQQKALYDLIDVPMADGSSRKMTRFQAAQMLSGGAGALPPGFGASQTPGAKATQEGLARVGVDQIGDRSKAATTASLALPQATAQAQQTIGIIDALLANPEMKHRTGVMSVLPAFPGSSGAGFDALHDQLTGQVFMQAYSTLKGGGQITEVEGKKATAALARLSRAQSPEDYSAGLRELRSVIANGLSRAQAQASGGMSGGQQQSHPSAAWTPEQARAELARRRAQRGQ